jgi:hypothetical protein
VALSNLTTKLGTANEAGAYVVASYYPVAGYLVNSASQSVGVLISFDEAITVGAPAPTLQLISNAGEANVVLAYNVAASDLTAGKLVFANTNFSAATAGYGDDKLVVNSTSITANWTSIKDAGSNVAIATSIPAAVTLSIPIYQAIPTQGAAVRYGTATANTGQKIGFALDWSEGLVVTGTPGVIAVAPNTSYANLMLSYVAAASNLTVGNLVFQSAAQDFSAVTANVLYTLATDGTSLNAATKLDTIVGAELGSANVANAIYVGNTFSVVSYQPFAVSVTPGADIYTTTGQVISFSLVLDRHALVTGTPTIRAISSNASVANVTLGYVSGDSTGTLLFSNTVDLSAITGNQTYVVNSTSVITGFSGIANTTIPMAITSLANASGLPLTTQHLNVLDTEPLLAASSNVTAGSPVANHTAQTISFSLVFDRPVVVSGTPTVRAITSNATQANVSLSYVSGAATGTLLFSYAGSLVSYANTNFAVNSSSVIVGFSGISNNGVASTLTGTLTGTGTGASLALVSA